MRSPRGGSGRCARPNQSVHCVEGSSRRSARSAPYGHPRGQTALQRLSEPRTRLGWSEGGWVGFGLRLSSARAALSRAWADSLPENRLHGVIGGKLDTYASDARVRRWPNKIEITGKRNTSMTDTAVSAAPVLIRYAKRIDDPVSVTIAAELATAAWTATTSNPCSG